MKRASWLITGGCGFIGTNLVHELTAGYDCRIRIVDNFSVGSAEDLAAVCDFRTASIDTLGKDRIELIEGDILDREFMLAAAEGIDCIVHLAANTGVIPSMEDPEHDCRVNVLGTLNCLEAARTRPGCRFILASSGAPLGEQEPPIREDMVPRPLSPYGASKLAGEGYCSAYHGSFGVSTAALRFGNVYGPRSVHKGSVIAKFIRQIFAGETLTVYGDGNQTRDFIFTGDLVRAVIACAGSDAAGEIFQIATSSECTINELLEELKEIFSSGYGIRFEVVYTGPRKGEVLRNYSDISKARRMLGWEPRGTLREHLEETVGWFAAQNQEAGDRRRETVPGRPSHPEISNGRPGRNGKEKT
ncbi:GDP-mannose 4,6-dehydratase [bacterium]|nr:GDP-mannose 4,6-dehydratase [bacterium]